MDVTTEPPPSESLVCNPSLTAVLVPAQDTLVSSFAAVLPGVQPVHPYVDDPSITQLPTATPPDAPTTSTAMDAETDPPPVVDDATSSPEYWWRDNATGAWYRKLGWDGVWTPWSEADAPPSKRRRTGGPEESA